MPSSVTERMRRRRLVRLCFVAAAIMSTAVCTSRNVIAQEVFKGRTITLYAGFTPGGGIDNEMRLISQYLEGHIPGAPSIQPMNMPGAGGILLGNHLYSIAKPDGLTLGLPGRSGFFLASLVGDPSARYDISRFTWIGSSGPSNLMFWVRKGLGIKSWREVKSADHPIVVGGLASSSASVVVPMVVAKYEHVPLRVISGYTGLSEVTLAMQRGEVDMIYTAPGTFRPDLIQSGEVVPLLQTFPVEPELPSLQEIKDPRAQALLGLLTAPSRIGAPVIGPPNILADTAGVLRRAYLAMSTSRDYLADARRRGIDLSTPSSGEDLQDYVRKTLVGVPDDVVTEYKGYVGLK